MEAMLSELFNKFWAWLLPLILAFLLPILGTGCAEWKTPAMFPREAEQAVDQASMSMFRQLVIDNGQFSGSFAGQDPGIETYYEQSHAVGTRIRDVDGQFSFAGAGHGIGNMPPDLAEAVISKGLADDELQRKIVEWILGGYPAIPEPEAPSDEASDTAADVPGTPGVPE